MKSICLYSSYFEGPEIPYYVRYYLEQLRPYFTEMVFVTNRKELSAESNKFLVYHEIELMEVKNEGFDFGMWSKALEQKNVKDFDRLAFINDSCILYKDPKEFFSWLEKTDADYCGMVDSNAISYHLQSYFVVAKKNAIPEVLNYFKQHGIKKDVHEVIRDYEVGLSSHLIKTGYKLDACYSTKEYKGEYSPTYFWAMEMIERGMPLIKKKIIYSSFRVNEYTNLMRMCFELDPRKYIAAIKTKLMRDGEKGIDWTKVEMNYGGVFMWKLISYNIKSGVYQLIRKQKPSKE